MKTNALPTAEQIKLDWNNNPRWTGVQRNYSAEDVVRLRGTVHVEHSLARHGAERGLGQAGFDLLIQLLDGGDLAAQAQHQR